MTTSVAFITTAKNAVKTVNKSLQNTASIGSVASSSAGLIGLGIVATIVTGGVAGIALSGALIGAGLGVAFAGASDYANNGKITKTTKDYISYGLGGAVAGAVAGVGGMALASKATLKTAMAIGGASSMAGDMTTQFVGKGSINPLQAIKAGVVGAVTAGAFYGASKAVGSIKNSSISKIEKEVGSQTDSYGASKSVGSIKNNLVSKVEKEGGSYSPGRPTEPQGFSKKGYNPQPGERTFEGYVKNNVSLDAEVSLNTNSSGFNNNSKGIGGEFKRFGSDSHGGLSPHVHQPVRNVNRKTGDIFGGTFNTSTNTGGVTSPNALDIKQLYQFLNNGKYK